MLAPTIIRGINLVLYLLVGILTFSILPSWVQYSLHPWRHFQTIALPLIFVYGFDIACALCFNWISLKGWKNGDVLLHHCLALVPIISCVIFDFMYLNDYTDLISSHKSLNSLSLVYRSRFVLTIGGLSSMNELLTIVLTFDNSKVLTEVRKFFGFMVVLSLALAEGFCVYDIFSIPLGHHKIFATFMIAGMYIPLLSYHVHLLQCYIRSYMKQFNVTTKTRSLYSWYFLGTLAVAFALLYSEGSSSSTTNKHICSGESFLLSNFVRSTLSADSVVYAGLPGTLPYSTSLWNQFLAAKTLFEFIVFNAEISPRCVIVKVARYTKTSFDRDGFVLAYIEDDYEPGNLDTYTKSYYNDVEGTLREMFPNAKGIKLLEPVFRGIQGTNEPISSVHFDYWPNMTENFDYSSGGRVETGATTYMSFMKEKNATEGMILGVWKPFNMNTPVQDNFLASASKNALRKDDMVKVYYNYPATDISGEEYQLKSIGGSIKFNPLQEWYYYSNMTINETLIFTHYDSRFDNALNAHSSVSVPGASYLTRRKSIETRAMVVF